MEQRFEPPEIADSQPQGHLHAGSFGHGAYQKSRKSSRAKLWIALAVCALLLMLGVWFSWRLTHKKAAPRPSQTATQAQTQQQTSPKNTSPQLSAEEASTPVVFKSTKLNIELTYRKAWTLKESADKSEIILTSPHMTYATKSGASTDGVFTLKFRMGVSEAQRNEINKQSAVRASETIGYTAPTQQQRYYTNISYAGQDNGFHFFIVSGSTQYKLGDAMANTLTLNGDTYLIVGGYGADNDDTLAFDTISKDKIDQNEVFAQAIDVVKSLKIF